MGKEKKFGNLVLRKRINKKYFSFFREVNLVGFIRVMYLISFLLGELVWCLFIWGGLLVVF